MGRAPNRRDLGAEPGPYPTVGAAGKVQSRKPPPLPHGKKPLPEPIYETSFKVTGIAPSVPDKPTVPPKKKSIAGKQTPGISEDVAVGVAFLPGKKQIDMSHAQTEGLVQNGNPGMPAQVPVPMDAAGNSSVSLAAHMGVPLAQIADTSNSRKKNVFNGNHSTVDSVVFGCDIDDTSHADKRDFTGAAGNLSSTADYAGIFAENQSEYETKNKAFAMRSVADTLIFNRDTDGMDSFTDPRDFEGAAGSRSESQALSGLFSEKVDKVSFEDIPHAKFAPPGLRKVDSMGSRAEEIIYCRKESLEDTDYIEKPYYQGAAGESSVQADKRLARELLASKVKLKSGTSKADKLIFGHDLDNSEADDAYEAMLYSGAGTRSDIGFNPYDVTTRTTSKLTDSQVYGFNCVVGTDIDGDKVDDPRDFTNYAGNSTKYLSEREMSTFDITKRESAVGAGSSVVNPSEADELIFGGRNLDKSGEDKRDFEGAAGHGARLNLRNPYDITTNPPKRLANPIISNQSMDATADKVIYNHEVGGKDKISVPYSGSIVDMRSMDGEFAGKRGALLDKKSEQERQAERVYKHLVAEKGFDLIRGEHSSIVPGLIAQNASKFMGTAGVTSADLDYRKAEDHKRAAEQIRDMVPDPNLPPGEKEIKPARKAEYARLHKSTTGQIVFMRKISDKDDGQGNIELDNSLYEGHAGLTSDKLANLKMADISAAEEWGLGHVPEGVHMGAAGRIGSTAEYEAKSRRAIVENAHGDEVAGIDKAALAFDYTHIEDEVAQRALAKDAKLRSMGTVAARAAFRHHSQSERVGQVVFGQKPMADPSAGYGNAWGVGEHDRLTDASYLRGTITAANEEHFETAAGLSSPDVYHDLQHKLDDKPAKPRLHMMSDVDEVVFGHDVDMSSQYEHIRTKITGAGKNSKAIVEDKHWRRRDVARADNAGTVDDVVFHHDVDYTDKMSSAASQHLYQNAAGASSAAILTNLHLNDPGSRMHYPIEFTKPGQHSTGNEESVDEVVFNHDMDLSGSDSADGVVFKITDENRHLVEGASGNKSAQLAAHKIEMQRKLKVPVYDQTRAQVDEILYGKDLDPRTYTEADIEKLQLGAAGKSSVTKELEVRSESKKMVPHEYGYAVNLVFPEDEGLQTTKISEVQGNIDHDAWQSMQMSAGNSSVHNAHLKHRELEYVDGQKGSRKARGSPRDAPGAAGKKIGKESALMQTKKSAATAASGPGMKEARPFGKASGLRSQSDSEGVASVLGSPKKQPSTAYELALAEGRALLTNPYTHQSAVEDGFGGGLDGGLGGPKLYTSEDRAATLDDTTTGLDGGVAAGKMTKSRTGYTPPKYGVGDAAGNYRKERMLVHKSRPEAQFGAPPPFGVDPVIPQATQARFSISSATIGGNKQERIIDYQVRDEPPRLGAPAANAIVAAGQRPLIPVGARKI